MLKERIIYKLQSPTNRIYIGQTCNLIVRRSMYKTLRCEDQPKLYNSLKKYGYENHIFSILVKGEFTQEEINELEIEYIEIYKANSQNNLNVCSGGGGHSGHKHSEESKEKMRIAKINYVPWNKGKKMTEEYKLNNRLKRDVNNK